MDKVSNSGLLPVGAQSSSSECLVSECSAERVRTTTDSMPDGRGKASNESSDRNKICAACKIGNTAHDRSWFLLVDLDSYFTDIVTIKSDITAILARKNNLQAGKPSAQFATMERSRLNQARTLALRRQDYTEVEVIDQQLSELPAVATREEDISDMLAKVNERNRKANLEAVRKAELQEAERKRRERKVQAARAVGTPTPQDPSARLKTVPKLFNSISRFVFFHCGGLRFTPSFGHRFISITSASPNLQAWNSKIKCGHTFTTASTSWGHNTINITVTGICAVGACKFTGQVQDFRS